MAAHNGIRTAFISTQHGGIMREVSVSTAAAVHRWAQVAGDAPAIIYEGTETTYAQLSARVREMAGALSQGGLRAGDRVAYLGHNSALLLETALAAAHLGAIFLPANFRLAAEEVSYLLHDSGTHTVVAEDGHRPVVDRIADGSPVRRFLLGDRDPLVPAATSAHPRWEPLSEAGGSAPRGEAVKVGPDDTAVLMYTSGTTGRPKGVMLTHGNLWWNHLNVTGSLDVRPRHTTLAVAPMFHIGGLNAFTLGALARGGTVVVRRAFEPAQCLDDLARYRVNSVFAVPVMFAALACTSGFAEADLTALTAAVVAGAPVPGQLVRDYAARGVRLQQAWGLTETAPFATYLPGHLVGDHPDSAGFPMPYTEIRLTNPETGATVTEARVPGEVCVRGPHVTPGYWNNPEATAAAFDCSGWFHSGDIGYLDEGGLLHIVDRLKDMIISGGENVYPAEIERVLAAHPDVHDVAVVGVPHPKWGETPIAVLRQDGAAPRLTIEEVRAYAGQRLARYKLPTAVSHVEALPRNPSGKLDKVALRAWALSEYETAGPLNH
ncbi:Long-chain-fatty-acid--CoA ligase FadD13 [Streptomyces rimosus subsp. rimosus]|nr:Long-chain-fatty-acid--CoA ligase FadD13 [Streptomyces rimosus subsp. rimosus]UTH93888.1 Long-chain-fatty-acid--CoA ligase FadD13 [Streptomyces rimosus subsp. rimosus]UTJ11983.1 Long-chain-fatty-acid--CoA ligase FadD13 [Streptomyces rimosus subsp. rimosus]